jgi:hypothetical protein
MKKLYLVSAVSAAALLSACGGGGGGGTSADVVDKYVGTWKSACYESGGSVAETLPVAATALPSPTPNSTPAFVPAVKTVVSFSTGSGSANTDQGGILSSYQYSQTMRGVTNPITDVTNGVYSVRSSVTGPDAGFFAGVAAVVGLSAADRDMRSVAKMYIQLASPSGTNKTLNIVLHPSGPGFQENGCHPTASVMVDSTLRDYILNVDTATFSLPSYCATNGNTNPALLGTLPLVNDIQVLDNGNDRTPSNSTAFVDIQVGRIGFAVQPTPTPTPIATPTPTPTPSATPTPFPQVTKYYSIDTLVISKNSASQLTVKETDVIRYTDSACMGPNTKTEYSSNATLNFVGNAKTPSGDVEQFEGSITSSFGPNQPAKTKSIKAIFQLIGNKLKLQGRSDGAFPADLDADSALTKQ